MEGSLLDQLSRLLPPAEAELLRQAAQQTAKSEPVARDGAPLPDLLPELATVRDALRHNETVSQACLKKLKPMLAAMLATVAAMDDAELRRVAEG